MSLVQIRLAIYLVAILVLLSPSLVLDIKLHDARAQLTGLQAKYDADEQKVGILSGQLSQSQADLDQSKKANSIANASIDAMKQAADAAAAEEARFRLAVQAQQATYGKIIAARDSQIKSLKAQQEGCDDAIADLRAGQ